MDPIQRPGLPRTHLLDDLSVIRLMMSVESFAPWTLGEVAAISPVISPRVVSGSGVDKDRPGESHRAIL